MTLSFQVPSCKLCYSEKVREYTALADKSRPASLISMVKLAFQPENRQLVNETGRNSGTQIPYFSLLIIEKT